MLKAASCFRLFVIVEKEGTQIIMRFMVEITFIPQRQSEIAALVPKEQAHIKTLMEQGIVQAIYISADRSYVWVVMQGKSQEDVQQEVQSFPLYPYMNVEFTALV